MDVGARHPSQGQGFAMDVRAMDERGSMSRQTLPLLVAVVLCVAAVFLPPATAAAQAATEPPDAAASSPDQPAQAAPVGDATPAGKSHSSLSRELAEQGEAELQKSVRVFQQRYLLKAHRLEVMLGGATSLNDPWVHHYAADASLLFHLTERWAIGAAASRWFGSETTGFNDVQTNYGLFPEKSELQAGGFGEIHFSPVFGKFTSFGLAVLQVDAYVLAGGGALRTSRNTDIKAAGEIGGGVRIHTLRWLTLALELKDILFSEQFQTGDSLMQHVFVGAKIGLWIPPTVQYRYQR